MVISIIAFIAVLAIVTLQDSQRKSRDAVRLADMKQVVTALNLYYDISSNYPTGDGNGSGSCASWDTGNQTNEFLSGQLPGILAEPPEDPDPAATDVCDGYFYRVYTAGTNGCDSSKGSYYVLGVVNMETSSGVHKDSPGWSCTGRNWQDDFDWVTGQFQFE